MYIIPNDSHQQFPKVGFQSYPGPSPCLWWKLIAICQMKDSASTAAAPSSGLAVASIGVKQLGTFDHVG